MVNHVFGLKPTLPADNIDCFGDTGFTILNWDMRPKKRFQNNNITYVRIIYDYDSYITKQCAHLPDIGCPLESC